MPGPIPKSRRQYVQSLNTPTKSLLRRFKRAAPAPMPAYIEPLLAKLRDRPPVGDNWVHEIKFDGYRFQLHIQYGRPTVIYTRRGHDWTEKAKSIAAATFPIQTSAVIDGEIVVISSDGTTDFNELERELGKRDSDRLTFYAFDVPYLDGYDLRNETLLNRKEALKLLLEVLPAESPIKYSDHVEGDSVAMRKRLCDLNLEGIVSKLKDSRYVSGRSDAWVKVPCRRRETFAIVGWALKGRKFDGFYLGEERGGRLEYAGKIEGGWTEKEKVALLTEVREYKANRSPLATKIDKPKAQWVDPCVLVDVEYRAKTKISGLLRHPTFKGVRRDLMDDLATQRHKRQRPATKNRPRARRSLRGSPA
jgi:bifunctional non-homologous end joining protein LigD